MQIAGDEIVARTQATAAAAVGKEDDAGRILRQFEHAFYTHAIGLDTDQLILCRAHFQYLRFRMAAVPAGVPLRRANV